MTGAEQLLLAATAVSLALGIPALAAAAPAAVPPVADGDMGCFVALGTIEIDADKASKSDKLEQKDRDTMAKLSQSMNKDSRWYFGRVSALPPEQRTRAVFHAAFVRMDSADKKQTFDTAMTCSKWALDANTAMLDTWSGK